MARVSVHVSSRACGVCTPARSRMTLLRGDNVWEQFLEEAERLLSLRQYGVAVIALMEASLQLQGLHLPWLQLLQRRPA